MGAAEPPGYGVGGFHAHMGHAPLPRHGGAPLLGGVGFIPGHPLGDAAQQVQCDTEINRLMMGLDAVEQVDPNGSSVPASHQKQWNSWMQMKLVMERSKEMAASSVSEAQRQQFNNGIAHTQHQLRELRVAARIGWDGLRLYRREDLALGATEAERERELDSKKLREAHILALKQCKTRGRPRTQGPCWNYGSKEHQSRQCPHPEKNSKKKAKK